MAYIAYLLDTQSLAANSLRNAFAGHREPGGWRVPTVYLGLSGACGRHLLTVQGPLVLVELFGKLAPFKAPALVDLLFAQSAECFRFPGLDDIMLLLLFELAPLLRCSIGFSTACTSLWGKSVRSTRGMFSTTDLLSDAFIDCRLLNESLIYRLLGKARRWL